MFFLLKVSKYLQPGSKILSEALNQKDGGFYCSRIKLMVLESHIQLSHVGVMFVFPHNLLRSPCTLGSIMYVVSLGIRLLVQRQKHLIVTSR